MPRLQDLVTVITGAGSGIGAAIATTFAAEEAVVVVTDRAPELAATVADRLGPPASAHLVDVTERATVDAMVGSVLAAHGRIDVLVNNAGWDVGKRFIDTDASLWERVIGINYVGVLNTCHAVLPVMAGQGHGSIVNLASDAARVGSSGEAVYAGAKAAVVGFSKAIAREHARDGVNVNVVCPGPTDTALFAAMGGDDPRLRESLIRAIPVRRLGRPQDVAAAVAFLASADAAYITGQTLSVSGGLTMS